MIIYTKNMTQTYIIKKVTLFLIKYFLFWFNCKFMYQDKKNRKSPHLKKVVKVKIALLSKSILMLPYSWKPHYNVPFCLL